jgi:glycosyltransferase involved in cell wall biosynthesis
VTLSAAGYEVTLIQRGETRETVKGVNIVPLPTYRGRLARMTLGVWTAFRLAAKSRADVIHFHDAEFIWGALMLKALGRQVVYDVHEDLPKDLEDKPYLPRWCIPPLRAAMISIEWIAKRAFDRVSAATQSISERFDSPRTALIRNTPILGELTVAVEAPFAERPPHAAYLGGLAQFNGTEQMVSAMGHVPDDVGARLVLGGKFTDARIEASVRAAAGWSKVEFVGWVDRSRIGALLSQVRCGLVVYQPTPNVVNSEPNKFFEVLSAGLPLVASDFPVWRAFIERYQCGLVVNPADPQAIGEAISYLLRNPAEAEAMGARGRAAVLGSYNWGQDGAKLVEMYEGLEPARHHRPSTKAVAAAV